MTDDDFSVHVIKSKCMKCNFVFFTHYKSKALKMICDSCNPENPSTVVVKSWE